MHPDDVETLQLIERAILAIQARQHPGRPLYYAMSRLRDDVRQAQREALAASVAAGQASA